MITISGVDRSRKRRLGTLFLVEQNPPKLQPVRDKLCLVADEHLVPCFAVSLHVFYKAHKLLSVSHHLLELELEDHLVLQRLQELIRREVKGTGGVIEITKQLPRVGVFQ